jgi:ATP-dependent Clp protease protease subunit
MSMRITRDDLDRFMHFGFLPATRTIYLGEARIDNDSWDDNTPGVDYRLADQIIKSICILESINSDPITIIINNPGGNEYHGLAIYDAIRATPCFVTVRIIGHAMSMAAWFAQAADHRIMFPNATMMIHYGTMGIGSVHTHTFERWGKEVGRLNKLMEKHLLERIIEKNPKFTLRRLREKLLFDSFLTAPECVELGLADEVLEFPEREAPKKNGQKG